MANHPIQCVGVIMFKDDQVLLIKRGRPPNAGHWSIPGGKIEPGETQTEAALRELFEETGLRGDLLGKIAEIPARWDGIDYCLHDYVTKWQRGAPIAGDDAAAAKFVKITEIDDIIDWKTTVKVIKNAYAQFCVQNT